jgi:hypothetical protein
VANLQASPLKRRSYRSLQQRSNRHAGKRVRASAVPFAADGFPPAGLGDGDLFGLNKRGNLILNLRGVGDATGVGLGATSAVVFLRIRFGVGEAAGDWSAKGDAALSVDGVASVSFCIRCFGGEGDSTGVPVSSCE